MRRGLVWRWLGAVALFAGTRPAAAHDLAIDQLVLIPDRASSLLRGQVTFDPHRTRDPRQAVPRGIEERLVALLGRELTLEVDGKACAARYQVRELWVPAGATLGDVVNLSCPMSGAADRLRVSIAPRITHFAVTVQSTLPDGSPVSHSVLLAGGETTPEYRLSQPGMGWLHGGAEQFQTLGARETPDAGASPVAKPPSEVPSRSGAEQGWLVLVLGLGPPALVLALIAVVAKVLRFSSTHGAGTRRGAAARASRPGETLSDQRPRPSSSA